MKTFYDKLHSAEWLGYAGKLPHSKILVLVRKAILDCNGNIALNPYSNRKPGNVDAAT
jgi:hypothetical protein